MSDITAAECGRKSWAKRSAGKTREEISAAMRELAMRREKIGPARKKAAASKGGKATAGEPRVNRGGKKRGRKPKETTTPNAA